MRNEIDLDADGLNQMSGLQSGRYGARTLNRKLGMVKIQCKYEGHLRILRLPDRYL